MIRTIFTALLGIACILVLYFGQSYWNDQIQQASAKNSINLQETTVASEKVESKAADLLALAKNWPVDAVARLEQTLTDQQAYKMVFVGSPAIGSETDGTYPLVKSKLIESFGEKSIEVNLQTFDSTSAQLINDGKHQEIAALTADLYVIEPFILANNGKIRIEQSLASFSEMIESIRTANPAAVIIIQPSHPLYNAKNYPKQVEELKSFAEANQLTYLDHWSVWPDPSTENVKEFLLADQTEPSEKGIQVWSDYLIQYFISQ